MKVSSIGPPETIAVVAVNLRSYLVDTVSHLEITCRQMVIFHRGMLYRRGPECH